MAWGYMGIFMLVSAVCCCIGFRKYVYFLSVGYGFAVAGLGVAYAIATLAGGYAWNAVTLAQWLLFVAYGARLSGFLLRRELKNKSYREVLNEAGGEKSIPFPVKLAIWVSVSALYVMQTCPVFYRVYNEQGAQLVVPLIGALLSAVGLALEALSDRQKSAQKAVRPGMVATGGLFRIVRCPNYFGEILFWTGVFVGSCGALRDGQWILAVLGYLLIVMIMFNGAQRLDRRQERHYGALPEYRAYADHTPLILPFVPLYHIGVKNKRTTRG